MVNNPPGPWFDIDERMELKVHSVAQLAERWRRPDAFYWILTLDGTAYYTESGRSQFLRRGWVLAKQGPLSHKIRLDKQGSWQVLCLSGSNEFTVNRMAYVARRISGIHSIPFASRCVKLARNLVEKKKGEHWEQMILAFHWFHAWWQEADNYSREILRLLESAPTGANPAHHISSLKSLAGQLGYSSGYLSHILEQRWRQSPARSLRKSRMEFAARQLRETSIHVGALANELGYLSESAFVRAFRIYHGQPPIKYRKAHEAV